jgi:putative transposase
MPPIKKPPDKLWYPTLLQVANNIQTNSWFDMNEKINNNPNYKLTSLRQDKDINYLKTMKILIYPNEKQKEIILKWYNAVIEAYNITNKYIKDNKTTININNLSIKNLRSILNDKLYSIQNKESGISKHTLDYSVSHCISMYKSANTNLLRKHIDEYNIKDLSLNRNRYNLVVEPQSFSKKINGIFTSVLGHMNSERKLIKDKIKHNCILQYHKNTKKFYLIIPTDKINTILKTDKKYKKCGIDLGIRTFATIYTPEKVIEIGNNTNKIIDRYLKKLDNINSQKDKSILKQKLYDKLLEKNHNNIKNRIDDLHKKTAVFLTKNFKEINLGKLSIKVMISKSSSNLKEIVKRRGMTLSFYKFNEFIKLMSKKYNSKINMINEYKTSMTCHSCKSENKKLGQSKIYKCVNKHCKIELGRDVNASINIYNGGILEA